MQCKDDQGNPFECIEPPINSGGEGHIYRTTRRGYVIKVYNHIPLQGSHIKKLEAMIQKPPLNPQPNHVSIAWPERLAYNKKNECIGFLMPEIQKSIQIIQVYNPVLRKKTLPKFSWKYLHHTALGFAKIVNALHFRDYIIGDIKPQNILVNERALVSVVDTDSFQVKVPPHNVYRCTVTTEGFTPPELLSLNLANINQTKSHDRYRLALIIYHLLFFRHPFDEGTWIGNGDEPSQVDKMKDGIWLYSRSDVLQPNKLTISLDVLHPELKKLFILCFNNGHNDVSKRPSAQDWINALEEANKSLKSCSITDNHVYYSNSGKCYWCDRSKTLNTDIFPGDKPAIPTLPPIKVPPVLPPIKDASPEKKRFSGIVLAGLGLVITFGGSPFWGILMIVTGAIIVFHQ